MEPAETPPSIGPTESTESTETQDTAVSHPPTGLKERIKQRLPTKYREFIVLQKLKLVERFYRFICWQMRLLPGGKYEPFHFLFDTMDFTPENMIEGHLLGLFPSPIHCSGEMRWHDPDPRCVIPIHDYHIGKKLRRLLRQKKFEVRVDTDCRAIIEGCAEPAPGRETTYLTPCVIDMYMELCEMGLVHSVGTWQDGQLVGGLFGVALGGFFSLTSQFHRVSNAGQVATAYHLWILEAGGFALHDAWWNNNFLSTFGAVDMPRAEFKRRLARAVIKPAFYHPPGKFCETGLREMVTRRQAAGFGPVETPNFHGMDGTMEIPVFVEKQSTVELPVVQVDVEDRAAADA